jgi:hypothetical protein
MKKTKIIVHPLFFEASHYAKDAFWKRMLQDLAYNDFPWGITIKENMFICSIKNKEFNFKLDDLSAEELCANIYTLFQTKLNIYSNQDCVTQKNNLDTAITMEWDDIKKKTLKNILIENYVISMKNKYSLSNKQMKKLFCIIMIGLYFKQIKNKDITYDAKAVAITHINIF